MLTGEDYRKFRKQIIDHEGLRLVAYRDTVGILTVGIGHNCKASPVIGINKPGDSITEEHALQLFDQDIKEHSEKIEAALPWIGELNPPRQAVLYNMGFNLGIVGLLGFKNTLAYIHAGNYANAARNMLKTKWAYQVGDGPGKKIDRAERLAKQMETGDWQGI